MTLALLYWICWRYALRLIVLALMDDGFAQQTIYFLTRKR